MAEGAVSPGASPGLLRLPRNEFGIALLTPEQVRGCAKDLSVQARRDNLQREMSSGISLIARDPPLSISRNPELASGHSLSFGCPFLSSLRNPELVSGLTVRLRKSYKKLSDLVI
ncbi:MAG: hypothetical protein LC664_12995 [Flavobacteriales bacterium]|nr:hypothetical protein [Flavobacteriales bacterium]